MLPICAVACSDFDEVVGVGAVAAAVEDGPAAEHLDGPGVVRGVAVYQVDAAVDQLVGKADLIRFDVIAPVGSPVDGNNHDVTGRFTACTRLMTSSAAASDRSGSKSKPGRSAVAAQLAGIPLEGVPHAKMSTRWPPAAITVTGRRASPASRPAPAARSPAPDRASRVSVSPRRLYETAGLRGVAEWNVDVELVTRSPAQYREMIREHVSLAVATIQQVDEPARERIAKAVIAKVSTYEEDGKVRIPGVARCIVGTK